MRKKVLLGVVAIFSFVILLFAAPDIFGPLPRKGAGKKPQTARKSSSSVSGVTLIGVVWSGSQKYAIFSLAGRYLVLREGQGQGKKLRLEKVLSPYSVIVRYAGRKKVMRIEKKRKKRNRGGKK